MGPETGRDVDESTGDDVRNESKRSLDGAEELHVLEEQAVVPLHSVENGPG